MNAAYQPDNLPYQVTIHFYKPFDFLSHAVYYLGTIARYDLLYTHCSLQLDDSVYDIDCFSFSNYNAALLHSIRPPITSITLPLSLEDYDTLIVRLSSIQASKARIHLRDLLAMALHLDTEPYSFNCASFIVYCLSGVFPPSYITPLDLYTFLLEQTCSVPNAIVI